MKKAEHAEWLRLLDLALLAIGCTKEVVPPRFENHVAVPHYTITTKAGPLTLHPEVPYRVLPRQRLRYDCTIYGRFSDLEAGQKLTGHWKWNAHYGPRMGAEIPAAVAYYTANLKRLLP